MRKVQKWEKWQKIGLAVLIIATLAYLKIALFPNVDIPNPTEEANNEELQPQEIEAPKVQKPFVNVFFIAQNDNKEEVYRAVKREYDAKTDGSKLNFAIKSLLNGPKGKEQSLGVYSEIPSGTRLISLEEDPNRVIINLSGEFEAGGGTEGIYKRLYQLIKTANKNSKADVYLYINGKQADVIGGEGIMINQPLNEKSLDE